MFVKPICHLILLIILVSGCVQQPSETPGAAAPTTPPIQTPLPTQGQNSFCGRSTGGVCSSDSDCVTGGCSSQICQSRYEEPLVTTCEWRDCYDSKKYGLGCKCINGKCQWK